MTEIIKKLIEQAKEYIEKDAKERQSISADFNIFKITGIQSDEVKMCRMLAEIINPNGTNKKGMFFLKSFIEKVLGIETMGENELASAKVYTEYHTKTDRRIDISIVTNQRFIPIEVKIYAEDQAKQCRDYYDFAIEQGKIEQSKVYYLTIDGHLPQKWGAEGLTEMTDENERLIGYEEIIPISFRQDVYSWLKNCLQELKDEDLIRVNIEQYMYVLGELSETMSEKLNDRITEIISANSDNFEVAAVIAENVDRVKEGILLNLFETLESKLEKATDFPYEQLHNKFDYKYNDYESIKKFFSVRKQYPALTFKYRKVDETKEILFRVEVDYYKSLCCGFVLIENGDNPEKLIMKHEELEQYVNAIHGFRDSTWWFYWEFLLDREEALNINSSNKILAKLLDQNYFDEFTDKCVKRIIELTKEMKK